MITRGNQDTRPTRSPQGSEGPIPEAHKITAAMPYDFEGKNLTAYGGLLPVATMLEKLGFQRVVEEALTVKRDRGESRNSWAGSTASAFRPVYGILTTWLGVLLGR